MLTITISQQWNGTPIAPEEHTTLQLTPHISGLKLVVNAPFYNDPPPPSPPGSCWKLWDFEVVELFIAGLNGHYLEIECGPHGHYLALRLNGVRSVFEHSMPTSYQVDSLSERWEASLIIPNSWLPTGPHRLNAYAIHGIGSERKYLAWVPLPGENPDFHQPSHFRSAALPNFG